MTSAIRFIYAIIWFAVAIGVGEALVDMTNFMRSEAMHAHQKGLISYKLFTEQLTYGQRMKHRQLAVHKREKGYLLKMKELRSQGFTYEQIAQALNSLGIPTKTHKGKWHRKTINAILKQN